jgi:predicted glycoside hydrolase/deacetylase ChbG (UPF0249 family)
MVIINADDYGKSRRATENILCCYEGGRINSASAMVFMVDSERAAELALESRLDTGLHINFTERFSAANASTRLIAYHEDIGRFLRRGRFFPLLYNPLLSKCFDYVFKAQRDEYTRLYRETPGRVDGHEHMHLCANMILGAIIPVGISVRRNFSFSPGEKSWLNRVYRHAIDSWLARRYEVTDYFFGISEMHKADVVRKAANLGKKFKVEVMVHPERQEEFEYLESREYFEILSRVPSGTFLDLREEGE